ncbi:MAG: hypothetical protein AB8B52_11440 [Winogradskyella sp.]|uniref:hypothetical protein n=1 Tax=Winogradskyella sp. TaxID=1883156 RepID=UPI00385C4EBC
MRYLYLLFILCCFNCNNERVLELPEIENTEITEVLDVSPAYIFYDETQTDSTLLNRKNLIITTNWLVNVDKRLTLKQALPHIKFLQDKKRNAEMHKNEEAKNYFTCNDTAIENLGFIEFTDIFYKDENPDFMNYTMKQPGNYILLKYHSDNSISISVSYEDTRLKVIEKERLDNSDTLKKQLIDLKPKTLLLFFDTNMSFQDYISAKSQLLKLDLDTITISPDEFMY